MLDLTDQKEVKKGKTIDLTDNTNDSVLTSPIAVSERAERYNFAMGEGSPGVDEIKAAIISGTTGQLRDKATSDDYFARQKLVEPLVQEQLRAGNITGLNVGDAEYVQALSNVIPKPRETVLEELYAEKAMSHISALDADKGLDYTNVPGADFVSALAEQNMANRQIAISLVDEYAEKTKSMGWGEYLFNTGLTIVPFLSWANAVNDRTALEGDDTLKLVQEMYKLPPAEFKFAAQQELDRRAAFNPLDAEKFANALYSYGAQDADLDNFFNLVDVADLLGAGKAATAGVKAASKASREARRVKEIAKAVNQKDATVPDILANTGHTSEAAEVIAKQQMITKFAGAADETVDQIGPMVSITPSLFNPKTFTTEMGNFPAVRASRLEGLLERNILLYQQANNLVRPATLTPDALEKAYEATEKAYRKWYGKLSDSIVDVQKLAPEANRATGTARLRVLWGNAEGAPYITESAAKQSAVRRYRLDNYKIVKTAEDKYVIETFTDVQENDVGTLITHAEDITNAPKNDSWTYVKSIAGAKEIVSNFQAQQRAVVSHGTTAMGKLIQQTVEPSLSKLTKSEVKDLDTIMAINRDTEAIPGDPASRGMFYNNPSELNQAYLQHFKRPVTENEEDAYFSFRQFSDFDYFLNARSLAADKIRKGYQTHKFYAPVDGEGKRAEFAIEAKPVDELPATSNQMGTVLFIDSKQNKVAYGKLTDFRDVALSMGAGTGKGKKSGTTDFVVLQTYNPLGQTQLTDALGIKGPVNFILTQKTKMGPIRLDKQINYRPGFHSEYQQDWFIKQGRFGWQDGRRVHTGDTTFLGVDNQIKGKEQLASLEEARKLYNEALKAQKKSKAPDWSKLQAHLESKLPFTLDEFITAMKTKFDPDTPFVIARNGRSAGDASSKMLSGKSYLDDYGKFDSLINSPWDDSASKVTEFIGEKDAVLREINNVGTDADPVYRVDDAAQYSPINTQMRAMGRLMRKSGFEDYQLQAVQAFVYQYRDVLKFNGASVPPDELLRNPLFYFRHAEIAGGDTINRTAAWQQKSAIEGLVGTPSAYQLAMDDFRLKLLDRAYKSFGEKGAKYVPDKVVPFLQDPLAYSRAMVSHMKLGLFNPKQLFLQQATHANIVLISPKHGLNQIPATVMMRLLSQTNDPKIIDHFADKFSSLYKGRKADWTKEMFKDSYEGYRRSGFGDIGGEYAWRNDISDPSIYRGTKQKVLDMGYLFFNHAEKNVRMASWNTAYSEYLEKYNKKAGNLKEADWRQILNRAQALSGNMSRDASAFWQRGATGSFTQYFAYTSRITELLLGKQLSLAERMRLGGGLLALYGFPAAAGIGYILETGDTSGLVPAMAPFGQDLRGYAMEKGYNLDESTWGAINNGLASAVLYQMTGEHLDVAASYSPFNYGILDNVKRNMDQNGTAVGLLVSALGASGSVVRDIITSGGPIFEDLYQMAGGADTTKLLMEDILTATREISSLNNLQKAYAAWSGNMYLSKKGTLLDDGKDAEDERWAKLIGAAIGTPPYEESDTFRLIQSIRWGKEAENEMKKSVTRFGNLYLSAMQSGDRSTALIFRNKIEALLASNDTMTPTQKNRLLIEALSGNTLSKNIWDAFVKSGTPEENAAREKLRIEKEQE